MFDRVLEAERSVSLFLPAAEISVAVLIATRARNRHMILRGDNPCLQGDQGGSELERRPGRIASLNDFIDQRATLVFQELLVVIDWNSARELVRIPARRTVQGEYFAGVRIDCNRAALQRIGKNSGSEFLQIEIDVGVQRRSALWI